MLRPTPHPVTIMHTRGPPPWLQDLSHVQDWRSTLDEWQRNMVNDWTQKKSGGLEGWQEEKLVEWKREFDTKQKEQAQRLANTRPVEHDAADCTRCWKQHFEHTDGDANADHLHVRSGVSILGPLRYGPTRPTLLHARTRPEVRRS